MNFVELNRTFEPYTATDQLGIPMSMFAYRSDGLRWPDLLVKYRVVIIAEANSGKTEEFRERTKLLVDSGKPAFFVSIESLCNGKLDGLLSPENREIFNSWKAGSSDAFFFLDSVDEAATNGKQFVDALRNVYDSLQGHLGRARIFISSRPKDWDALRDNKEICEWLSYGLGTPSESNESEKTPEELMLEAVVVEDEAEVNSEPSDNQIDTASEFATIEVVLKPLDFGQRRTLIQSEIGTAKDEFEKQVGKHGLIQFATSPGDLLKMIAYWVTNHQLSRRQTICQSFIKQKLHESKNKEDSLENEKAIMGAKRVAAAMTLCRTFSLATTNSSNEDSTSNDSLNLADILDDWSNEDRELLLGREIFAPFAFGRVKFYHREAQEFLCAKWFDDLIENHCSPKTISDLFFPEVEGTKVVSPALKPVVAWLALWRDEIHQKVIDRDSLILIEQGDPGSLALPVKDQLLRGYAAQVEVGNVAIQPIPSPWRTNWLFADPQLAPEIRSVWNKTKNDSLRLELLQMIEDGAIAKCADLAEAVATNQTESFGLRLAATDALNSCQATEELKSVASNIVANQDKIRADHAASLVIRLYPTYLGTDELLGLVQNCPKPPSSVVDGFGTRLPDFWSNCPSDQRLTLAGEIAKLVFTPPFYSKHERTSSEYRFLAKRLPSIANDLMKTIDFDSAPEEAIEILLAIGRVTRFDSSDDDLSELKASINGSAKFKRLLLWRDVDLERMSRDGYSPHKIWQVPTHSRTWEVDESDVPWLKEDLASKTRIEDRKIVLSALARHFIRSGQLSARTTELELLIQNEPELLNEFKMYTAPPTEPDDSDREFEEREKELDLQREKQLQKIKNDWISFRNEVVLKPKMLLDPATQFDGVESLTIWLRNKTGDSRQSAAQQWELLRDAFSEDVANNFQAAIKAIWRTTEIARPEREGRVSTRLVSTVQAYAGVSFEAQANPNWAKELTDTEAVKAARIACEAEIDYPDWIDELIEQWPDQTVPVFTRALQDEFESSDISPFHLTQGLKDGRRNISLSLADGIAETICKANFPTSRRLEDAIRIFLRLPVSDRNNKRIAKFAKKQFQACNCATQVQMKSRYLSLWMASDPSNAIKALEEWLDSGKAKASTQIAIEFFGDSFGHHGNGYLADFLGTAQISEVEQLALIANRFILKQDDPMREGHKTPNKRDAAQHARNRLVSELSFPASVEGMQAIKRLIGCKAMKDDRHWLSRQLRTAAEQIGDLGCSLSIVEFKLLEKEHSRTINNADDLYRVVQNVLNRIKDQLNNSDASSKSLLKVLGRTYAIKKAVRKKYPKGMADVKTSDEESVQHWLSEQLRLRANRRFHVHREPQVAKKKMPDIIVSDAESDFEVSIEIKQADSWTTSKLIEALEVQLAETYLRSDTRRHGILFMTDSGRKGWNHPDTNKRMSFEQLIQFLSERAAKLIKNGTGPISVCVVGIDIVGDHSAFLGTLNP